MPLAELSLPANVERVLDELVKKSQAELQADLGSPCRMEEGPEEASSQL